MDWRRCFPRTIRDKSHAPLQLVLSSRYVAITILYRVYTISRRRRALSKAFPRLQSRKSNLQLLGKQTRPTTNPAPSKNPNRTSWSCSSPSRAQTRLTVRMLAQQNHLWAANPRGRKTIMGVKHWELPNHPQSFQMYTTEGKSGHQQPSSKGR